MASTTDVVMIPSDEEDGGAGGAGDASSRVGTLSEAVVRMRLLDMGNRIQDTVAEIDAVISMQPRFGFRMIVDYMKQQLDSLNNRFAETLGGDSPVDPGQLERDTGAYEALLPVVRYILYVVRTMTPPVMSLNPSLPSAAAPPPAAVPPAAGVLPGSDEEDSNEDGSDDDFGGGGPALCG